jgi:hypothetical protein
MKKLLILALLFSIKQADAQVCFSLPTNYPVGSGASGVVSADFNGDGFADMAVSNNADGNVSIFLGTGTGTFGTAANFSVGSGPYSMCTADFNGDSKADLAVTNFNSNDVSILLGNGTGGFSTATNIPVLGYGPLGITTADFNHDGIFDIVTANSGANNASLLVGTGTGSFTFFRNDILTYSVGIAGGTQPHSVTSGDYNADGYPDVALANYGSNNITVALGQGWGGFDTASVYTIGSGNSASAPFTIISADLNGDGKLDLAAAAASSSTGYAAVFIGTGTGSFPPTSVNTSIGLGGTPTGLTGGDFNADGKMDLAVTDQATDNLFVLLGSGTTGTTYTNSAIFSLGAGSAPNAIITSDFDGNAKPDLAVANWNLNNAAVLLNAPLPNITAIAAANPNCAGTRDSLFGGGGVTYVWTGASGITDGVGFVTAATKTYSVTGTNSNGCTNKATITITVTPLPTLTITATPSVICAGQSTVLSASGASTYTWNTSATGANLTISPTGNTVYTVTGTAASGCKNTKSFTVTISPSLTLTTSTPTICVGDSALLVVKTSPVTPTTYTWSTSTVNDSVYVHPTANATYSVIATTIASGCQNTGTISVSVTAAVPAAPTAIAGTATVCANTSHAYLITTPVPGAASYAWVMPTGWTASTSTSTSANTIVSSTSGTITVSAKNACGSSPSASLAVTVNPLPVITVAASAGTVCIGQTATLTAHGANTYVWSIGTTTLSAVTVTVSPISNTTYTVKGTDANLCVSSTTFSISGSPIVTTTSTNHGVLSHTVCVGDSILLVGHGAASYSWNSTSSINDSIYVHPTDTTNYIVTGANANGCTKRDTTKIYVNTAVPAAPSALNGPTSICANGSYIYWIPAAAAGAYSYSWVYPAGWHGLLSVTTGNVSVTDSTTSGVIAVAGKNTCGIGPSATLSVTVNALPTVSFVLNPNDTACLNVMVQFTSGTPSGGSYSGAGITFITGTFDPNTAGVGPHVINYYYSDANGCVANAKDTVFVKACAGIGVQSYAANNSLRIYPNPNNGTFVIETNSLEVQSVQVFDVNGKMVMNKNISGNISIDATNLTEGIYNVKLTGAQGVVNKKLVIVK